MIVVLTKHAKEKMMLFGINKEDIKKAIAQGAKFKQTDGFVAKYMHIRIPYKIRGDRYIIKNVLIER